MNSFDTFDEFSTPIVIDNGSGQIKAGLAGHERPRVVIPSCVGSPKHRRVMLQAPRTEKFLADQAMDSRGLCTISYPIKHGIVENWNDMTQIWQYIYKNLLNEAFDEHPLLLTEAPNNPIRNRTQSAQIFFEQLSVPAMFFAPSPVLALYASGRKTGCVLDSGHGVTTCIPIYEGFALPHAITRMDVAGDEVTNYFQLLLRKAGITFHTSAEMETVRMMKEKLCEYRIGKSKGSSKLSAIGSGLSSKIGNSSVITGEDDATNAQKYSLPDGTELKIGSARMEAPEVLFDPTLIGLEYQGIQHCVLQSIAKADLDLRRDLYRTIVISGGGTNCKNFGRRLSDELHVRAPKAKVRIYAPRERHLTTWIGGSLLSFLEGFRPMWIQRKEWSEMGPSVVFRKSFF